jgi:Zn-dependent peptidase ImmA (M78 family)/DNA-binding XRE family transcriptional regulator
MDRVQKSQFRLPGLDDADEFNGSRLVLARMRKGLTISKFAALIGVDRKSVNAYECGRHEPSPETMARIVSVLEFPSSFFVGDDIELPTVESGSFRSMKTMLAAHRDAARSQVAFGLHFSNWLDKKFGLPKEHIPDFSHQPNPEMAAEAVRREWGLGELSIRNTVHLMESKGVRVFSLAVDARQVDAFSMWKGEHAFIFLNTNKTAERSRFDAAHELGHLVLHKHGIPQGFEAEREADAFAAAFLMPRGSVNAYSPQFPSYSALVAAKTRWTVSVGALAYRMHELGLMSDWQLRSVNIEISQYGREHEPNEGPREISLILPKILGELYAEGITCAQIARELTIPVAELEQLLFGLTMTSIAGGKRSASKSNQAKLTRVK